MLRPRMGRLMAIPVLLAGMGYAIAQPGDERPDTEPPANEGAVEVERQASLTGTEQLAEASNLQRHGTQISRRVASMLDGSRRESDIIRVTCLDDKLTQVDANLRTVGQRVNHLQEAVDGNDTNRRNHEYTVLTVLGQKFSVLEQEANQCIGQDIFETGSTRVTTTVDPATPDADPTSPDNPPDEEIPFIPPPESPVM